MQVGVLDFLRSHLTGIQVFPWKMHVCQPMHVCHTSGVVLCCHLVGRSRSHSPSHHIPACLLNPRRQGRSTDTAPAPDRGEVCVHLLTSQAFTPLSRGMSGGQGKKAGGVQQ